MRPEIKIVKIPLKDSERCPDYPKAFPSMPQLYLELLENKDKIKQDLINKEYVPQNTLHPSRHEVHKIKKEHERKESEKEKHTKLADVNTSSDSVSEDSRRRESHKNDKESCSTHTSNSSETTSSIEDFKKWKKKKKRREDTDSDSDDLSNRLKQLLEKDSVGDKGKESDESLIIEQYKKDRNPPARNASEDLHRHTPSTISSSASKYTPYKRAVMGEPETKPDVFVKGSENPPTLAQLREKGQYTADPALRNIDHVPQYEINDENTKRELLFKFEILRKSYSKSVDKIPNFTIHTDLKELQKSYDGVLRELSLDSTVENYKMYLIGGFFLVEYACGNFLGFDMEGFAKQQIISMHSYEKLLIELGEKSYVPSGSRWPVELRLLFLLVINAGIFIVGRIIMRKTGANVIGLMNSVNTGGNVPPVQKPKQNMKGPTISLEEIEKSLG